MKQRFTTSFRYSAFEKKLCPTLFKKSLEAFNNLFYKIKNNNDISSSKNVKVLVEKTTYHVVNINGDELEKIKNIYMKYRGILESSYYRYDDSKEVNVTYYRYHISLGIHIGVNKVPDDILKYHKQGRLVVTKTSKSRSLMVSIVVLTNDVLIMSKIKLKHDYVVSDISEIKDTFEKTNEKLVL